MRLGVSSQDGLSDGFWSGFAASGANDGSRTHDLPITNRRVLEDRDSDFSGQFQPENPLLDLICTDHRVNLPDIFGLFWIQKVSGKCPGNLKA